MGWPLQTAAVGLLALSAPYVDTQDRFRLEIPEGWSLAPRFGDTAGMVFSRAGPGHHPRTVQFEVRVEGVTTARPADRLTAYLSAKTGGAAPAGRPVRVGAHSAARATVEYEGGPPTPGPRVVTVWALTVDSVGYLLVFDRPRSAWNRYRPEIETMLRSFAPRAPRPARRAAPAPVPAPPPSAGAKLSRADLVGRWRGPSGVELAFSADGRFILGDVLGRYTLSAPSALELEQLDGRRERFSVERDGRRLILRSSRLAEPAVYHRDDEPRAAPAPSAALVGTWKALIGSSDLVLRLDRDGRFTLGPYAGTWTVKGNELRLVRSPQERVTYRFRYDDPVLWLSGGDLDQPISFVRDVK